MKTSVTEQKSPLTREQVDVMNRLKKLRVECAALAAEVAEAVTESKIDGADDYGRNTGHVTATETLFARMASDIGRAYTVPRNG